MARIAKGLRGEQRWPCSAAVRTTVRADRWTALRSALAGVRVSITDYLVYLAAVVDTMKAAELRLTLGLCGRDDMDAVIADAQGGMTMNASIRRRRINRCSYPRRAAQALGTQRRLPAQRTANQWSTPVVEGATRAALSRSSHVRV
ncbi:MAG: hypothetical protein U1F17_15765 [Burkholderiaceae bacterium]